MKIASLLILGYFYLDQVTLSSSTLSSSTGFDDGKIKTTEFSQQHKTELNDLSVELQLMMLEKLNLIELLNMSSTNEYYRQLSADVFRRKIGAKTVVFRRLYDTPTERFEIASINDSEKLIYIEYYDVMLAMLKNFGHLLTTLQIDFGYVADVGRRKQMTQYASKYCSETLLNLHMQSYTGFNLDYFPLPFKNVEKLSVSNTAIEADKTTLDQKFPAVRQLILKNASMSTESVSGGKFPNLEHISIEKNLKPELEAVIPKSPNLKSLLVERCSYELLSFVNKHAPQLVELTLLGTTYRETSYLNFMEYRFKNVKKLFIKTGCNPPNNLIFDQLDDLRIDGSYYFGDEWLSFIVKNTNLTRFEFSSGYLGNRKLAIIADSLKNLEDATIKCDSTVQTATITRFVRNNDKLKRLEVIVSPSRSSTLKARLGNEWNLIEEVERVDYVKLHFEKK